MLPALLGSRLRAKVLGWLFTHPDERHFVRQLASLIGEDSTNVSRELSRLERLGVLVTVSEGRQKYYQANRQSPVFAELHGLVAKTYGLADVLRTSLAPARQRIRVAFVFGSFASGTEQSRSDVDLMVVGEIAFSEVVSLVSPAVAALGREINPVVYPPWEFQRKLADNHHFLKRVLEGDKIYLVGDESELGRLAEGWACQAAQDQPSGDRDLLAAADRDLADAQVSGLSPDRRLAIAYGAALLCATAALAASGYRAAHQGQHHWTIQSLAYTMKLEGKTIEQFDAFRRKRNIADYEMIGMVSEHEVREMLSLALELRVTVVEWLRRNSPQLLRG